MAGSHYVSLSAGILNGNLVTLKLTFNKQANEDRKTMSLNYPARLVTNSVSTKS